MRELNAQEPITWSLIGAAALHAAVLLTVGFVSYSQAEPPPANLDVILVHSPADDAPDEADYLSTHNQAGGGTRDELTRPTSPFKGTEKIESDGVALTPQRASVLVKSEPDQAVLLTQLFSDYQLPSDTVTLEQDDSPSEIRDQRLEHNLEVARLSAELDELLNDYAKRPRKTFVSARTRESDAAAYMHAWVERVERIGNLNYPAAARARKLTGQLLLTVGVRRNGDIESVDVRRSSGIAALDRAAADIVRMASPFDPLSDGLRERTDILYITRTWEFLNDATLRSDR
ncbi:MAG: TonB family protein [Pseudomonadota bacterium]